MKSENATSFMSDMLSSLSLPPKKTSVRVSDKLKAYRT